jgi:hypothetical protein
MPGDYNQNARAARVYINIVPTAAFVDPAFPEKPRHH